MKIICLFVESYPQTPRVDEKTQGRIGSAHEHANVIKSLLFNEKNCPHTEILSVLQKQLSGETSEKLKNASHEERCAFGLLLLQFYDGFNKLSDPREGTKWLLSIIRGTQPASATNMAVHQAAGHFVALSRRFREMWKAGAEEPNPTNILPVFQHCAITDFSALKALQIFSEDLVAFVDVLPPTTKQNCLQYLAVNAQSQRVAVSFKPYKFADSDSEQLELFSSAMGAFVNKEQRESVLTVRIVAFIILQRLVRTPIFERVGDNAYSIKTTIEGDCVTKDLVEVLLQAAKGGVDLETFEKQLANQWLAINKRFKGCVLCYLFPGSNTSRLKICKNNSHNNFEIAAVQGCYACALKHLTGETTTLTDGGLKRLLKDDAEQRSPGVTQILNAMNAARRRAGQQTALAEGMGPEQEKVSQIAGPSKVPTDSPETEKTDERQQGDPLVVPEKSVSSPSDAKAAEPVQPQPATQAETRSKSGQGPCRQGQLVAQPQTSGASRQAPSPKLQPEPPQPEVAGEEYTTKLAVEGRAPISAAGENNCCRKATPRDEAFQPPKGEPREPKASGGTVTGGTELAALPPTVAASPAGPSNIGTAQPVLLDGPPSREKIKNALISFSGKPACVQFTEDQLSQITTVESKLKQTLGGASPPVQPRYFKTYESRDDNDPVQSLRNAASYFAALHTPLNSESLPRLSPYEDIFAFLGLLAATVKSLEIQNEEQAAEDISAAGFWAISGLQKGLLLTEKQNAKKTNSPYRHLFDMETDKLTKDDLKSFKQAYREKAVEYIHNLFNCIWKIFFELKCVAKSWQFCQLGARMIQSDFGPTTQLHFGFELWETFRTVDLHIQVQQENLKAKDDIADVGGEKQFSFVIPLTTDDILKFALRNTVGGDDTMQLKDLLKLFKGELCERKEVRQVFIGICIRYAIDQEWLSDEKKRLCKKYLEDLPQYAKDVDLAELDCIDFRDPKIPLFDSTPNWDHMEVTIQHKGGAFSLSLLKLRQMKAPNRVYSLVFDTWQCLPQKEEPWSFTLTPVYDKLVQTFREYSLVIDASTRLIAYGEYVCGARFHFIWKQKLHPLNPAMACEVHCQNMYDIEPPPGTSVEEELKRVFFLPLDVLNQYAAKPCTAEVTFEFLEQLVAFEGQAMVPIFGTDPDTLVVKSGDQSTGIRGWPCKHVVTRYRAMMQHFGEGSPGWIAWNKAAGEFFTRRLLQCTNWSSMEHPKGLRLHQIIGTFVNLFVFSFSTSFVDFQFNSTTTAFQALIVRVWAPILLQSQGSCLYKLFRIGTRGGFPARGRFFQQFLEVLENAGDKSFDAKALKFIEDAEKLLPCDGNGGSITLLEQASKADCVCNGASTDLHAAARIGCLRCAARHFPKAGTLVDGMTALMFAAIQDHAEVVELLALKEAGLTTTDGKTAAMCAAEVGSTNAVEALIPYEAGLQDAEGKTALAYAIQNGCAEAVKLLLPHEGEIADKNKAGPADHARNAEDAQNQRALQKTISPELAAQLAEAYREMCVCEGKSKNLIQAIDFGCLRCATRFIAQAERGADRGNAREELEKEE